MATKEEIFEQAKQTIVDRDIAKATELANQGLSEGIEPLVLMNEGFITGINEVGELFSRGQLFLPELIQAADTMQKVTEIINAAIETPGEKKEAGKVAIATVEGDIHDIGKTIVVSMFKANGFEVLDLGRDVSVERILEESQNFGATIIGTSALLTTTMSQQKRLEEELKKEGLKDKIKTMVGGAPVTQRWADRIGADAYAEDAADGVKKAKELI